MSPFLDVSIWMKPIKSPIDSMKIRMVPRLEQHTISTRAACVRPFFQTSVSREICDRRFAKQTRRKSSREHLLAYARRPAEQVRVRHPPGRERPLQALLGEVLMLDVRERHGRSLPSRGLRAARSPAAPAGAVRAVTECPGVACITVVAFRDPNASPIVGRDSSVSSRHKYIAI